VESFGHECQASQRDPMSKVVLIVDDEETNRELFEYMLKTRNYATLQAGSGNKGLEIILRDRPDLVLLDLYMEDGDGLSVLRAVRSNPAIQSIPIIIITAADNPELKCELIDAGCNALILKPIDMRNFLDTIDELLK
jgi:CheY-like chemotaxis protein